MLKLNMRELSRRLLSKVCEDENIRGLKYLVEYIGEAELELEGTGVIDVLFETAVSEDRSFVYLRFGGRNVDVNYALFTLTKDFRYGEEPLDSKKVFAELSVIEEKIKEVFKEVVEDYLCYLWEQKEEGVMEYKILNMSNSLAFSKNSIFECGDYVLPQCTDIVYEGECFVSCNPLYSIVRHYQDVIGNAVEKGWVVVYRQKGKAAISARVIEDAAYGVPSLNNIGTSLLLCEGKEIPTFNYSFETVADKEFVFLFGEDSVVPIRAMDMEGLYLAAELSWELDRWRVIYNSDGGASYFTATEYSGYEEARDGIRNTIGVQKTMEFWKERPIKEVSPFGLDSIMEWRNRRKWLNAEPMSTEEILDALKLQDGLEISGNPKKVARFLEALGIVTERLCKEKLSR